MGIHDGHRERLRKRYLEEGIESFDEINVLELLLFYAAPRVDTNPLAHRLLDAFGSLDGVLSASPEELKMVEGIGDSAAVLLKLIPDVVKKAAMRTKREGIQITSPRLAADYLLPKFFFEEDEKVLMLCLDANKRIIRCETVAEGVVNMVEMNVRKVAETALRAKASSVILAHNHPDGNVQPSREDIATTEQLSKALQLLGIALNDHVIVCEEDYVSLCELGYL